MKHAEEKPKTGHWRVTGRVQGVGFRWWLRGHAQRLGLHGWVRNLPNGAVEIAAGGDPSGVAALHSLAAKGPPGADVEHITALEPPAAELPFPFEIAR